MFFFFNDAACSEIYTNYVNVLVGRDGRLLAFNVSAHVATRGL
jgi:hypothetical protein